MADALKNRLTFLEVSSIGKSVAELIFLLVIFVVILIACYYTTRFVAGNQQKRTQNGNFKPIETFQVAQNRYLQLIQIGTRYFVLAITKDSVTMLCELSEEEFELKKQEENGFSKSFKEILSDLRVKVDKHDDAQK